MNLESTVNKELWAARKSIEPALNNISFSTSLEPEDARKIIGGYTGVFAGNFILWLGMTIPWVRHEQARYALTNNLRCEQSEDHVGMLLKFASHAGVKGDPTTAQDILGDIRLEFQSIRSAGLFGTALLATLEFTSQEFIPVLEGLGKSLGLSETRGELGYTRSHGPADVQHAKELNDALIAEAGEYEDPEGHIRYAIGLAVDLIKRVFAV